MPNAYKASKMKENLKYESLETFLKQSKWIMWGGVLMGILIFTASAYAQGVSSKRASEESIESQLDPVAEEETYKANSKAYTYKDMLRRPDLEGAKVKIKGRVSQAQQEGNMVFLNVVSKENDPLENVFIYYERKDEKEIRFLEEDVVTLWGELIGVETYTNRANNERTVPVIILFYYKISE